MNTSESELDQISVLLIRARDHRDDWLPLKGSRPSGFDHPDGSVDSECLAGPFDESLFKKVRRELMKLLEDSEVRIILSTSPDYPRRLGDLDGRPALLFVRGDIGRLETPSVSVVGSRQASEEGVRTAYMLASTMASSGYTIVSGLAAGVDSASHNGTLDGGGRTIAVMGTGLGKIYPSDNHELADRIAKRGALVTQFPPLHSPTKTSFPSRNVLVAGLSDATLVVEMGEQSGTRIEVNCAIAQGRRVLLWAPILGSKKWARQFAEHPRVSFIENEVELLSELSEAK